MAKQKLNETKQSISGLADTLGKLPDTLIRGSLQWLEEKKKLAKETFRSTANDIITTPAGLKMKKRDFMNDLSNHTYANLFDTKPLVKFAGGYVSYQFDYRSNIDTPYIEKDLAQHNTTGHLNFTLGNILPMRVTFWSRQSNSSLFRDITSVNVSFDAGAFRNQLQAAMRDRLLKMAPHLKDSLTEKLYGLKNSQLGELDDLLHTRFTPQALIEANQVLKVPGITWNYELPDSTNQKVEDSVKQSAAQFLELYYKTVETYKTVKRQTDSLKAIYDKNKSRLEGFKQLVNGKWDQLINTPNWREKLSEYGLEDASIPAKYKWLMGIRNFSLGRSTANTSELTAKNVSVNGINFEYNSRYYLGVTAGMVDYRFRDFTVNGFNRKPQFLYMLRAGIGRLEKNYVILGMYHGKKQLFVNSNQSSIPVTGFSLEAKWKVAQHTFLIGEVAKSISPDFRSSPPGKNTSMNLSDKSNQAISLKAQSYLPGTQTRIEGLYKKTGANFQSFSSFQANAALETWTIKVEQPFFRRMLRISGSLRKNEFSNPYLEQNYKSNTVFKSLTATFRKSRWPVVTMGYQPMSQLTVFDDKIVENRFQTLTGTVLHNYKFGKLPTSSTIMFNKFFNNQSDSGYVYFNSTNIYWSQQFMFSRFTASMGASFSKNGTYQLTVLEEGFQIPFGKLFALGFGVKVNALNSEEVKAGGFLNTNIRIFKQDNIFLSYERGYLPGFNQGLVRNEMASVQFMKSF
ncbi:hypothetical protein [Pseudoflavitalea rhizosphaerae]|uniref:hypothetical protein n=1 Tax=Pseudoflavitalea rhizosphaerae TaxID=1884793 RepID=UPI000F8DA499|nr:hypothetical protein [Pseudoflavitalea rhizosphaerae]